MSELREAEVTRKTKETDITVKVQLEGTGNVRINTSVKFLDHLVTAFATHSLIDIQIDATGDLIHHTAEDVALTIGEAINKALGERKSIKRFGFAIVPMDDALAYSAVDLVKRPFQVADLKIDKEGIEEDLENIYELFPRVKERLSQKSGTLSGGEQQMVAIGRALMSRPRVLLMDEPSMGLAPALVQQNFELIQQIHEEGVAIFMVEQNANMALSIADRGWVLQTGRVVLDDKAEALLANPELRSSYLGES